MKQTKQKKANTSNPIRDKKKGNYQDTVNMDKKHDKVMADWRRTFSTISEKMDILCD